ncbi:MAG: glycosyltransferase family 4 protein [Planctomycetota bacterium]|jgi:glycosyltransferase involved in cell wall biosynthesis
MGKEQGNSISQTREKKPVRPALIVSERTISVYSMLLKHILLGLADESVPAAMVCEPDCDVDTVVPPAVEVIRHPAINLPLMGWRNNKILVERLANFKPTILHCLCQSKARLTRKLAQQLDLPYVLMINSLQKGWAQFSVSSRRCAKIITPAESIAANLSKVYPRLAERIEQMNTGTFVREESCCFSAPGRLACMVTSHPFDNVRDFEMLLNAVKHLVIDGYEFLLVLIGSGRAERHLRKLLRALGLLWIVTIVPRLEPWRSVLAAGDIFIRPQPRDAFDPLLLEAMSVGAAVAACKGGVDDLIIEGRTAAVFEPDDELSIYSSLQRLLDSPESARQLATGAQERLRENHSVSKMISSTIQTYRNAGEWYRR